MKQHSHGFATIAAVMMVLLEGTGQTSYGQEVPLEKDPSPIACRQVFDDVENGLSTGNVGEFSHRFASQVALSLKGGESGTFSGNQAYYILTDYLKSQRFGVFEFSTIIDSTSSPYGTGTAELVLQGSKESVQVYVGLMLSGKDYKIAQLTIY